MAEIVILFFSLSNAKASKTGIFNILLVENNPGSDIKRLFPFTKSPGDLKDLEFIVRSYA